jgi:hypothetical protein
MSQAVITFVGICSHIRRILLTPPPDALSSGDTTPGYFARAIVVNASHGYRWAGEGIPPHDAILYIPKEFIDELPPDALPGLELIDPEAMTWKMRGVQIYIAGAEPGLRPQPSFEQVPSLTDRAKVLSLQLDPRVVMNGCAAAVVDMFAGDIDAYRNPLAGDAVHVALNVSAASELPELVVSRMWDASSARIRLKPAVVDETLLNPTIFVMNTGTNADKDIDFFLHYLVTTWTPPSDQTPPVPGDVNGIRMATPQELLLLRDAPAGLTFGCSNSNYP